MKNSLLLPTLSLDQRAELVNDMRDWAKDCQWADTNEDDIDDMTDEALLRGVPAHYSGGVDQFINDSLIIS